MTNLKKSLSWLKDVRNSDQYWIESAKSGFAVEIEKLLKRAGLNKSQFAHKINASSPYVTKMLRGDANLTIETMVKAARALDCDLHLHIAPRNHRVLMREYTNKTTKASSSNISTIVPSKPIPYFRKWEKVSAATANS